MTRKDYILIAEAISVALRYNPWPTPAHAAGADLMKLQIAINLAEDFGRDNPRFDRERFLKACGVQS